MLSAVATAVQRTGDQAVAAAKTALAESIKLRVADKRNRCVSVVGDRTTVCDCLSAALPIDVDFQRYVILVTTPRAEQTENDQKAAVAAMAIRDQCVAAAVSTGR